MVTDVMCIEENCECQNDEILNNTTTKKTTHIHTHRRKNRFSFVLTE